MKTRFCVWSLLFFSLILSCTGLTGTTLFDSNRLFAEESSLQAGFQNPPQSAKSQVWWHWNDDRINPKALTADLESMKEVGLGGAYIFFLCGPGEGFGMTPDRLELYRHAVSEAKRLGLKLGLHNCPGWSSSGGVWIKPEDSMKYLIASETLVEGGKPVSVELPKAPFKHDFYADAAVIAFPVTNPLPAPKLAFLKTTNPTETDSQKSDSPKTDSSKSGSAQTAPSAFLKAEPIEKLPVQIPISEPTAPDVLVECRFEKPVSARYLELQFAQTTLYASGSVEAPAANGNFETITKFQWQNFVDQGNGKILSLEDAEGQPKTSDVFRIRFKYLAPPVFIRNHKINLGRVRFFENSMIPQVDSANSSSTSFGYRAPKFSEQGIDPAQVLDLSDRMTPDGLLNWPDAPAGKFLVLRIGFTTTGKNCAPAHGKMVGLECDKLSRRGLDAHWPGMMEKILETIGDDRTLNVSFVDSYEVGGQNWTFGFDHEFEARRGYSMRPWFPALFGFTVGTASESASFLYDFQRTVADCFARNYYDYFAELCEKNDLTASVEAYGGPFDSLQCSHRAPFPVCEFWVENPLGSRYSSSAMRIHNRKINGAESFTTDAKGGRWQQDPAQLRQLGDAAWQEGVNLLILHSFVHQPFMNVRPGFTLSRHGTQFGRNNTWWKESKSWMEYLARGQFLLQSGISTSEILIFSGESSPNQLGIHPEIMAAGYDFDYCDPETLQTRVVAENGKIRIQGACRYEIFSLGSEEHPTLATLRVVKALLDGGALVTARKPLGSPSLADKKFQAEYDSLVKAIWETDAYPNFLPDGGDLVKTLKKAGIKPNFASPNPKLTAISRQTEDAKIFMLLNRTNEALALPCVFNVCGKYPEIWDAVTGKIRPVPLWRETEDGRTELRVELPAGASEFVVFTANPTVKPAADHADAILDGFQDENEPENSAVRNEQAFRILEARYRLQGATSGGVDVTKNVQARQTLFGLSFLLETSALAIPDPYSNQFKELFLRWQQDGQTFERVFREHHPVEILRKGHFRLLHAEYRAKTEKNGAKPAGIDVTEAVRKLITPDGFHFKVLTSLFTEKDPAPGRFKELALTCEFGGETAELIFPEHLEANLTVPVHSRFTRAELVSQNGRLFAEFHQPGNFTVQLASGKKVSAEAAANKIPAQELSQNWNVEFTPNLGAPEGKIRFENLISWTKRSEFGIRYFSGMAEYSKTFTPDESLCAALTQNAPASASQTASQTASQSASSSASQTGKKSGKSAESARKFRFVLNLGEVKNLAHVWLNGKDLGCVWCAPFELDVTEFLLPNQPNTLKIQVTNLWVNRMIGDEFHPSMSQPGIPAWVEKDQPNSGDGRFTWATWKGWTKEDEPLPAGLLGPVTLRALPLIELK